MTKYLNKNLIPTAIIVAGALIAGAFVYINQEGEGALSAPTAAEKAMAFIDQSIQDQGVTASLIDVFDEGEVYRIHLKIAETEYNSYITKDGKFLFPSGFNLEAATEEEATATNNAAAAVEKRERPDVKLFVMSYCPYGLQAEKMFLPVYNLLKDKAEMGVYFVNYIMHEKKEIDENLTQYCIQKNEKEKYATYLSCFVKDGNADKCLAEAKINESTLNSCVSTTDSKYGITAGYNDKSTWMSGQFPKFNVNDDLNQEYGVQGSPTIVINDKVIEVNNRSPESFKQVVCSAFNTPPAECSQTLSEEAASPGLGEATTGNTSVSAGGCAQ